MSDDIFQSRVSGPFETTESRSMSTGERFTIFDGEVDMREEISLLIAHRGHKIVYRRITDRPCPNYDAATHEEHPATCKYCMGVKFMYQDYEMRAYRRPSVFIESQSREMRQDIGYMGYGKYIYYLNAKFTDTKYIERFLKPTIGDFIIELGLDETTGLFAKAYRAKEIFDIEYIHDYRDKFGRVEYYALTCNKRVTGR